MSLDFQGYSKVTHHSSQYNSVSIILGLSSAPHISLGKDKF